MRACIDEGHTIILPKELVLFKIASFPTLKINIDVFFYVLEDCQYDLSY